MDRCSIYPHRAYQLAYVCVKFWKEQKKGFVGFFVFQSLKIWLCYYPKTRIFFNKTKFKLPECRYLTRPLLSATWNFLIRDLANKYCKDLFQKYLEYNLIVIITTTTIIISSSVLSFHRVWGIMLGMEMVWYGSLALTDLTSLHLWR